MDSPTDGASGNGDGDDCDPSDEPADEGLSPEVLWLGGAGCLNSVSGTGLGALDPLELRSS